MRQPLGYTTQYQEQFYNPEGRPACTTKQQPERQQVEFTAKSVYSVRAIPFVKNMIFIEAISRRSIQGPI